MSAPQSQPLVSDTSRLLQYLRRNRDEAGETVPDDVDRLIEVIPDVSGKFPSGDATLVEQGDDGRWKTKVSRGLTGPAKTLAPCWNDLLARSRGDAGDALRGLVGVFQTAILEAEDAVVRAARPWDRREYARPASNAASDQLAGDVLHYLGPELEIAAMRIGISLDTLVVHAGLFVRPPTAEGLERLVGGVTSLPVRARCRGRGSRPPVTIQIGPLNRAQFDDLKPGGPSLKKLLSLTRLYLGDGPRFNLRLVLRPEDVQPAPPDCLIPSWDFWATTSGRRPRRRGVARLGCWECRRIVEA